jgi:hypothetical protein
LGNITTQHALYAASKLLQYDVVVDLGDAGGARDRLLRLGMGWRATLSDLHARPKHGDPLARLGLLQKDVVPRLKELHEHDTFVYRQAQLVSMVDGAWLADVEQAIQGRAPGQAGDAAGASDAELLVQQVASNLAGGSDCGYFGGWVQQKAAAAAV